MQNRKFLSARLSWGHLQTPASQPALYRGAETLGKPTDIFMKEQSDV